MSGDRGRETLAADSSLDILECAWRLYLDEAEKMRQWPELQSMREAFGRIREALDKTDETLEPRYPFDERFNAVFWAYDVHRDLLQVAMALCWMDAHAKTARRRALARSGSKRHVSETSRFVDYHASHGMLWACGCRDKLGLLVWSFYAAFDPEAGNHLLEFQAVLERLKAPIVHGLRIEGHEEFLDALTPLEGAEFAQVKRFRDCVVHRCSPVVFVDVVDNLWDIRYVTPVLGRKRVARLRDSIRRKVAETPSIADALFDEHRRHGTLFEHRTLEDRNWPYPRVKNVLKAALKKLMMSAAACFAALSTREPLKSMMPAQTDGL